MKGVTRTPWMRGSAWRGVALAAAIALGSVGAIAATRNGLPIAVGVLAGSIAGALGILALPSIPTRRVLVVLLGLGGLAAVRHASFPGADTSTFLVCWAGAMIAALVLADRASAEEIEPLEGGTPLAPRSSELLRNSVAIAVIVAVAAVVLAPVLSDHLGRHVWPGADPTGSDYADSPASLRATDRLDMSQRPRLSGRVVFTVDARRGTFWRGETFDEWDGRSWRRSDPHSQTLTGDGAAVAVPVDPYDDGALTGQAMRQTFHIKTEFSDVVFAAPSPVLVETANRLGGRPDGTVVAFGGYGKGAVYTVTSRSALPTDEQLQAADSQPVPQAVLDRYAQGTGQSTKTTNRVRALALSITAPAATTYDKIRAIEDWLSENVKYSLDAPLAPGGAADIVDDFLFRSRVGWCEQVASSLVVMARSVGIPARLADGFVPGTRDALSGEFVVRERDAHAWAEIYFPGIGWQPFDPTASVPLAGDASTHGSWIQWARHHAFVLGLLAAAMVLAATSAPALTARLRRRIARRRAGWSARSLARLERIGRRAGRPRNPSETPREYATVLESYLGDARLHEVGDALDAEAFSRAGASATAREAADAVLAGLGTRRTRTGATVPRTVKGIP
jgi:transglutaminase-like putative cysteine protease/predicted secreted protein